MLYTWEIWDVEDAGNDYWGPRTTQAVDGPLFGSYEQALADGTDALAAYRPELVRDASGVFVDAIHYNELQIWDVPETPEDDAAGCALHCADNLPRAWARMWRAGRRFADDFEGALHD